MNFAPFCVSQEEWVQCSDDLLDLTFEYPVCWGTINAKLHRGFEAGFGYDYVITTVETGTETLQAMAAGQGGDYKDLARGGRIGDFNGFQGKSSVEICQDTPLCEVIKPGVVLTVNFVDSHFVCDFNQGVPFYPFGTVMVNLPEHNLINGFMFVSKVLSPEEERKLLSILDVAADRQPKNCSDEARSAFDAAVMDLKTQIQSGVSDNGTFNNLQALRHLAESLVGEEVAE